MRTGYTRVGIKLLSLPISIKTSQSGRIWSAVDSSDLDREWKLPSLPSNIRITPDCM